MTTSKDVERPTYQFDADHLEVFKANLPKKARRAEKGKSKKAQTFAAGFFDADSAALKDEIYSHDDVVKVVQGTANSMTKCAAILAWGGMRMDHRRLLIAKNSIDFEALCKELDAGTRTRRSAFDEFKTLRKKNDIPGLGSAFFTKLIYFFRYSKRNKNVGGYIMDQWASESVNLLVKSDNPIVRLDTSLRRISVSCDEVRWLSSSTVSDKNDADDYEMFCSAMDQLVETTELSAALVDLAVMGLTDDKPNEWRDYVMDCRQRVLAVDYCKKNALVVNHGN